MKNLPGTMTSTVVAGVVGAAALLLAFAAPAWQPAPSKAVAERIKRDAAACKKTRNLETCDDAVRWDPSDPALLIAFGDALMRTKRPADALRQYQRAAALAPKIPGVGAKISAAEARIPSKRAPTKLAQTRVAPPVPAARAAAKPPPVPAANAAAKPPPVPAASAVAKPPPARAATLAAAPSYANDAAESHSH